MENINGINDFEKTVEYPNYQPSPSVTPPNNKTKNFSIIAITIGLLFLISAVGVGAYYLGTKNNVSQEIDEGKTVNNSLTKETEQKSLFTGQIKKLDQDLKLFKKYESDYSDMPATASIFYYSAGVFNQGELKGYTRIIALLSTQTIEGFQAYILATKDFQTFILDDPDNNTVKYTEKDWQNPYRYLDKNKIISTKSFDTELTKEIVVDKNFSLYKDNFLLQTIDTGKIDSSGYPINEDVLATDFSSYQKLNSPSKNLAMYFRYSEKGKFSDQLSADIKAIETTKDIFIIADTEIIVVDSTGLPMTYSLSTPKIIKNYLQDISNTTSSVTSFPGLTFSRPEIETDKSLNFYKSYSMAIPGGCGYTTNTRVIKVSDNELEQIGTASNIPIYALKDKNHSLYKLAYDNKMQYYTDDSSSWAVANPEMNKPSFSEYVNNNPLLFFKDSWQRWVILGEYDIQILGGCGKPVIYLYPEKTTDISVKFKSPVQFTADIPKYGDSWQVSAQPNGILKNLKSNDCNQIDVTKKGSEYALSACQKNEYPYLYWAGNILSENYPTIDKGWIVEKDQLTQFIKTKLSEIGLNSQEKEDFVSYWLPDMLSKNTPYYRISFLQTRELNSLFPMTVSPSPDTVFRIFLDYLPLEKKPESQILPQVLNKLSRKGFTLVEWGGLKRY